VQLYNNDGRNAAWSNDELEAYFVIITAPGKSLRMSISRTSRAGAQRPSCSPKTRRGGGMGKQLGPAHDNGNHSMTWIKNKSCDAFSF